MRGRAAPAAAPPVPGTAPEPPCEGPGVGGGGRRERPRGRGAPAGPRPRPPSPLRPLRRVSCRYIRRGAVGRGVPSGEAGPGVGGGIGRTRREPPRRDRRSVAGARPGAPSLAGSGAGGRGGSRPGLMRGWQPAGAEPRASSPPSPPAWAVEAVGWRSPTATGTGGSGYPRPIALSPGHRARGEGGTWLRHMGCRSIGLTQTNPKRAIGVKTGPSHVCVFHPW